MRDVMQFIREFTVWLHQPLLEYGLFYIDLWSLVHFWSGLIIFVGLSALKWEKRWGWLAFFLLAFELVEATIFISIMKMFRPEKLPDCFTDIIVGMAGGYLIYLLFEKWKVTSYVSKLFLFWLTAGTLSFLWTGNSGYLFNNPEHNASGFNWWVFVGWMVIGILILYFYDRMRILKYNTLKSIVTTWIAYLVPLLILSFGVSNMSLANESSWVNNSRLVEFLPDQATKNFFYFTAPFFFISVYFLLNLLFRKYVSILHQNESK
jgi:hypothetical protein